MRDILNSLTPAALSAAMRGGTEEWGQRASAKEHIRYVDPIVPRLRRRCDCGCGKRATHTGKANGIALIDGCEFSMHRWVSQG
jgi:hypothetical protein